MSRTVTTPPAAEPITIERARRHLRVDQTVEDDDIKDWIAAARQFVEAVTEHALMAQTWTEALNAMPTALELRGGNVRQVAAVRYVDAGGDERTVAPALYEAVLDEKPPMLRLAPGAAWPAGRRWRVEYHVGYPDADSVPRPLVSAVLLILADLFENRGAQMPANLQDNPAFSNLVFSYSRIRP
ncbi:hypothetical protein WKR98_23070 [Pigmentiphaga sp. YJ18]|uniref:head-tail connector protein n=1 Tax=Pigmentiphaga sp. YJ18 TaxID=3134907 RepID=UPI003113C275